MARPSIGDRELSLLRYLAEHQPATVGEVAADFGAEQSLARSTVLTMMERLRTKGYLRRRQIEGVYQYRATTAPAVAMRRAVDSFVQNTLHGSVSPFVAWMAERGEVSDEELAELNALVERLEQARKES